MFMDISLTVNCDFRSWPRVWSWNRPQNI